MKTTRLFSIAFLGIVCAFCASAMAAAPVDNPIAATYGDSAYPWANQIKWNAVYNILDYGGVADGTTDNVAAFNAARDAAHAAGGGVVYFPTGTYYFADNIQLKNGVVIRGDTPTGVTSGKTDGFAPPTKLVFPQYVPTFTGSGTDNNSAFKSISTTDSSNDSNIGVVNVDLNRARLYFSNGGSYSATNHNVVVFGVRSNNVTSPDASVPTTLQNAWQRFCNRFASNATVSPWRNALVANSRFNDNVTDNYFQPGYIVSRSGGTTVLNGTTYSNTVPFAEFSYTDHYGIVIGRGGDSASGATPIEAPSRFRPGVAIRDNYVYTTMRVKIHAGGYGTVVQDNVIRDRDGKQIWIYPTGQSWLTNYSATYENRGIDIAGYDITVSGNDSLVYRHYFPASGAYSSVDGEGILMQESSGTLSVGEKILNNTLNTYIGLFKMKEIRDCLIEGNNVGSLYSGIYGQIYVRSNTNGGPYPMYNTVIRNNTVSSGIDFRATQYASGDNGNEITGNTGTGTISYTTPNVNVHDNPGLTLGTPLEATLVNRGPDVAITSPTWLEPAGSNVTLTAAASDADGTVASVSFYNQATLLGTDTDGSDGWSLPFNNLAYGSEYMVVAKATDNAGATWVSDPMYFKAVLGGDANIDRYTDVIDLGILATNYGKTMGCQWTDGDFNEDGKVDVIDLGILATKYGLGPGSTDVLPEPATMSLLALGMVGLLRRK
jgi:hypothetical protein